MQEEDYIGYVDINGDVFTYMFAWVKSECGNSGIIVPPDAPLDNPEYLKTLMLAQSKYSELEELEKLEFGYSTGYSTLAEAEQTRAALQRLYNFVRDRPYFNLLPYFWEDFEDVNKFILSRSAVINRGHPGYVYLLQSPTSAWKIGRTSDPKNRKKTFSVKLPFEVSFKCLIKTSDMFGLERTLHCLYEQQQVNGEWFKLKPFDIEYIRSLPGASS